VVLTEEFVEMMICPACRGKVRLKEDASAIKCVACGRAYPIRNGIPAMIVEEATLEDEESGQRD
jgi:uncharacterized protein YbaR (Trm112 family)